MEQYKNDIGVQVPEVLLPKQGSDFSKWGVVACDQYTSQPDYWEKVQELTKGAPSTLHLILPEAFLGKPGEQARIENVKKTMRDYLDAGVLEQKPQGFVLVCRHVAGKQRLGLVMALDLEHYDYNKGATTLIRATEGTIVDRIPPRLRIREGAPIELPHILVLIDDPNRTVIEPLAAQTQEMTLLYDTPLMQDGGHITGHLVDRPALIQQALEALCGLMDTGAFEARYGKGVAPLLFAMGDGNHSFATAKAAWENIKSALPKEEWARHPARYALVEVENVHDEGIVFEPIHRVLFDVQPEQAVKSLLTLLSEANGGAEIQMFESHAALDAALLAADNGAHRLPFYYGQVCGMLVVPHPAQQLCVGTLQHAIDAMLKQQQGEVDYIHGRDVVLSLADKPGALGFLLPAMKKSELFKTVVYDGALPRKTFSMGEANEKRYYMECRKILP